MTQRSGYKIRSYVSGTGKDGAEYKNYSLTVPNEIAEALPEGLTFIPRMCDAENDGVDGIVFEPVGHARGAQLPRWARNNGSGNSKSNSKKQNKQNQQTPEVA